MECPDKLTQSPVVYMDYDEGRTFQNFLTGFDGTLHWIMVFIERRGTGRNKQLLLIRENVIEKRMVVIWNSDNLPDDNSKVWSDRRGKVMPRPTQDELNSSYLSFERADDMLVQRMWEAAQKNFLAAVQLILTEQIL